MSLTAVSLLLLIWPTTQTIQAGKKLMANSKPAPLYANASQWLYNHADEGDHIFQTDWDDFTRLFFYNSNVSYTVGLDPTFMELYDKALFDEWVSISRGRVSNPSNSIGQTFKAAFVFTDLKHQNFVDQAEQDSNLIEVYRDEYAIIYQVAK